MRLDSSSTFLIMSSDDCATNGAQGSPSRVENSGQDVLGSNSGKFKGPVGREGEGKSGGASDMDASPPSNMLLDNPGGGLIVDAGEFHKAGDTGGGEELV